MSSSDQRVSGKARFSVDEAIRRELQVINEARKALAKAHEVDPPRVDGKSAFPVGLALSGGGVRSATFGLGILQALAAKGLLTTFDYLSTVSGGGYIGGWLTSWIHRESLRIAGASNEEPRVDDSFAAMLSVEDQLRTSVPNPLAPKKSTSQSEFRSPETSESRDIRWLRMFSRYLAPRTGTFGLDSVTLATTWLRNVFLNLLVMGALLASLLLFSRLSSGVPTLVPGHEVSTYVGVATILLGAFFFGTFAIALYSQDARQRDYLRESVRICRWFSSHKWVVWSGALYLFLGGAWAVSATHAHTETRYLVACGVLISAAVSLLAAGAVNLRLERALDVASCRLPASPWRNQQKFAEALVFLMAGLTAVSAAVACFVFLVGWFHGSLTEKAAKVMSLAIGPPLALLSFAFCGSLFVGVVGLAYGEGSREWWARLNASLFRFALYLLIAGGLTFGIGLVDWILERASGWAGAVIASGWIGAAMAALLGPRVKVKNDQRQRLLMSVLNVCALVFCIGLVLLASLAVHLGVNSAVRAWGKWDLTQQPTDAAMFAACAGRVRTHARDLAPLPIPETTLSRLRNELDGCLGLRRDETVEILLAKENYPVLAGLLAFSIFVFVGLGSRLDVNRFSLHDLYKLRLVRCYLGASRGTRNRADSRVLRNSELSNPRDMDEFTGFDPLDDIPLLKISPHQRPLHIFNTAVNLAFPSLSWQDRRAASFTLSSLHCGFTPPLESELAVPNESGSKEMGNGCFAATEHYGRKALAAQSEGGTDRVLSEREPSDVGVTMGTAMAASGAAVNPASGASSKPALAFLLTVFNLRTGCWAPNPLATSLDRVSPRFGPGWLLRELFGTTDERKGFVHLSDGGHFENLGLYELVRRRCKLILCVDATADPNRTFGDLGNAIRRCRVDFGVEIEIDTKDVITDDESGYTQAMVVPGFIRYCDTGEVGRLIYVKPGLIKGEASLPRDIFTHHVSEPSFPHLSTVDQFFSEAQFESYRRLGQWAGERAASMLRGPA